MISRRVVVSLLLFVAILPVLGLISNPPETHGQAFTTITSYTATPTTVTSIQVVVVRTTSTTMFTRSDTMTSSLTQPKKLFSETIVLRSPPPPHGCQIDSRAFTAKKGQVISVNLESKTEFSLYILTDKDYLKWYGIGKCSPGEISDFTGAFGVTSYNQQLAIRNDGKYHFVFLNFGTGMAVIQFRAEVIGATYETAFVVTSRVVSHEYSPQTMTLTTMATGMLVRTEQLRTEEVGFSLGQNSLLIVAVVLLVIISVVVATVLQRRRREKPVATGEVGASVESQLAARRLCSNCGAELVTENKFCTNCGSRIS